MVGGVAVDAMFDFVFARKSLDLASVAIVLVFCVGFVSAYAAGGGVSAGRGAVAKLPAVCTLDDVIVGFPVTGCAISAGVDDDLVVIVVEEF